MKTTKRFEPKLQDRLQQSAAAKLATTEKLSAARKLAPVKSGQVDSVELAQLAGKRVQRNLADRVVDVMKEHKVDHVVLSALGSTEHTLGDAIARSDLPISRYHSESGAVSEAVGYNQVRNRPAAVLVTHSTPGTANSMGHLWDAVHKGGVPLVVLAGEADLTGEVKHMNGDPVEMAGGHIKFAKRVTSPREVESVIREAFEATQKPGHGPALVVLPQDLLRQVEGKMPGVSKPRARGPAAPSNASVKDIMQQFANPNEKWAIVVGDGVKRSGAAGEVAQLARKIGAPIFKGLSSQSGNIVDRDPMFTKQLSHMQFADTHDTLAQFDKVLLVGTPPNSYVFSDGRNPLEGRTVIAISENKSDLQRTVDPAVEVRANEKLTLQAVLKGLAKPEFDQLRKVGAERAEAIQQTNIVAGKQNREALLKQDPFTHLWVTKVLKAVERLAPDAALHDESITNSGHVQAVDRDSSRPQRDDQNTLGGALGTWPQGNGMSAALKKVVVTMMGDYGFYETMQALRAAAVNRLQTAYVVYDNGGGSILKGNAKAIDGQTYSPPKERNIYDISSTQAADSRYDLMAYAQGLTNSKLVTSPRQFDRISGELISSAKAGNPMLVHLKIPPSAITADHSMLAAWVAAPDGKRGGELQLFDVKDALGNPEIASRNTLKLDVAGVASARFNEQGAVELLDGAGTVLQRIEQNKLKRSWKAWGQNIFSALGLPKGASSSWPQ